MGHFTPQPIAIVGISADLPSGTYSDANLDHSSFFEFLLNAGEAYEGIPATRFDIKAWKGYGLGQVAVEKGSFLKDIDLFDPIEFGVSAKDVRAMAPATRKLIEQSFLALLDSGIDYRKKQVGCYMSGTSIEMLNVAQPDVYEPRGSFGAAPAMIANRVSTHLDLLGPSVPVDTACSSSMTALHVAVQALQVGDCEAAVVGGCQLNHRIMDWVSYSQSGVLSADGKCKPFDASADGFARAEGCVVVVIKPLEDALRDNDRVYATILATAINSTGAGGPPGAPVAESQVQAMEHAFKRAGKKPSDVGFVELHATGTAKGDPTEVNWVGKHFRRSDELLVGSVKGNIGHTEITAFLASLSKVLSIFEHQIIPPNINLSTPNPAIKWREYNLRAPVDATPLPSSESTPTLISMASSGIGGSNGHVVLQAPPPSRVEDSVSNHQLDTPVLFMAAGLSPRSASSVIDQLLPVLRGMAASEYSAASAVLGRRSKQMNWRSYAVATPGSSIQFSAPQYSSRDANPLVFVFSGQGPQHVHMGKELFRMFPVFRESILEMDKVFLRRTSKSMIQDYGLFDDSVSTTFKFPDVWPIFLTLPAIAMFQIALFDLLVHLGVRPDVVVGHSAGETAILYASGAAPKAMAVELAIIRGEIFSAMETSGGTMAALSCTPEKADELLAQHLSADPDGVVEVACLNAPAAVAIAGQEKSIDGVIALAHEAGIFGRKIRTRVPIHSSMMEACRAQYCEQVQDLFDRYPGDHIPTICTHSTLTGSLFCGPFDAEYFWMNTRSQVLFEPFVRNLPGASTFIEIAPHPVLSSYLSDMSVASSVVLSIVRRPRTGTPSTDHHNLLEFLGKLTATGHNCVNFAHLTSAASSGLKTQFPAYPFSKKQFPLFPETADWGHFHGPLNHLRLKLNRDTHPSLAEHIIRGEPIWPAAGFLEMALEFGATTLSNVNFRAMLPLSSEFPVPVNVSLNGLDWKVITSIPKARQSRDSGSEIERVHADGCLSFGITPDLPDLDIPDIRSHCEHHVASEFYPSLSYFSSYGPKFQRVTNLYYTFDKALASIRGIDGSLTRESSYILHPAILDACFQITAYRPFNGDFAPNNYHLPSRLGKLILHQEPRAGYFPLHIYAYVELTSWMPESMLFDIILADDLGKRLCTLHNFEVAKHHISPPRTSFTPLHLAREQVFVANSIALEPKSDGQDNQNPDAGRFILDLRETIVSLTANNGRQMIKIRISSDLQWIINSVIQNVLSDFSSVAFEVSIPQSCSMPENIGHPFIVVHRQSSIPRADDTSFDIVLMVEDLFANTRSNDLGSTVIDCDKILLPGGTLLFIILGSRDLECSGTDDGNSDHGSTNLLPIDPSQHLTALGYSISYSSVSSSCSILNAQKPGWTPGSISKPGLFNDEAFVFNYSFGNEVELQWEFSGLNTSQELEIWILALEGVDTAAGLGLVRALRREYLFWTIRFVAFPETFSEEQQIKCLWSLPRCMQEELEIIFSSSGTPLVPRLAPLNAGADAKLQATNPNPRVQIVGAAATTFSSEKTYIILGGIGNLGACVAMFLVQVLVISLSHLVLDRKAYRLANKTVQ
ncbi:hypothetical protein R3P38DRAFT_307459 [Favolaschia claudopus]|uniref:Polyketide synthase n=1 Tax=Favolaschia claudopus TaxID=2862362 RepID=A0AAW0CSF6_9AGAR